MTLFDRAEEIGDDVVVTLVAEFDETAGLDDVAGRALEHHRGLQHRFDLPDPRLVVALLVLGGVIVGVLADVAVLARSFDPERDLATLCCGALVQLLAQPLVRLRREMGFRHGRAGYPAPSLTIAPPAANLFSACTRCAPLSRTPGSR